MRIQSDGTGNTAGMEELESRRLRSASIEAGVLVVDGTEQPDKITLRLNHDDPSKIDVSINGDVTQFALADFLRNVRIEGHNGKDHLMVSETEGDITLTVIMSGGSGRDVLRSASGGDALNGGNGKDLVYGGAGSDVLTGGNGDDELHGQADNDILEGGRGIDRLDGEDGEDDLDGGKGKDVVLGGDANDDFSSHDRKDELADEGSGDAGENTLEIVQLAGD